MRGGFSFGKGNQDGRMLLEFCDAKHFCIANTWLRKVDNKRITYGSGCNKIEINFLFYGKGIILKNVKLQTSCSII